MSPSSAARTPRQDADPFGPVEKPTRSRRRPTTQRGCNGPRLDCTATRCVERLRAYDEHLDWRDRELAEHLGLKKNTFSVWRLRHELPPKPYKVAYHLQKGRRVHLSEEEHRRRLDVYHAHTDWTDAEMGRAFGITHSSARQWRVTYGLPPHRRRGERKRPPCVPVEEDARRLAAYHALRGRATEAEAATHLGINPTTFVEWRRAKGLPPVSTNPVAKGVRAWKRVDVGDALQETRRRLQAYLHCPTDSAAAEAVELTPVSFMKWRRAAGIRARHTLQGEEDPRALELLMNAERELQLRNLQDAARRATARRGGASFGRPFRSAASRRNDAPSPHGD